MHTVKFAKKSAHLSYGKQIPQNGKYIWGNCRFTFDLSEQQYDWFVAVDKIPTQKLMCSADHTILVTTEPSSISYYGEQFVKQFAYLITNQDKKSLPHANAIRTQPGSPWFYGKSYDEIAKEGPPPKNRLLSAIGTEKQEKHTLHKLRFDFIKKIADELEDVDLLYSKEELSEKFKTLYGNKAKYVPGKFAMIDDYKYHLAIGNQEGPNILTERVFDAFLGYSVPIAFGCTNLSDYFPKESFIEIDIRDKEASIEKIKSIISNEKDYERRLDAVIEARRRVMQEYNLIAMIAKIVENHDPEKFHMKPRKRIYSRRWTRLMNVGDLVGFARFKFGNFLKGILPAG